MRENVLIPNPRDIPGLVKTMRKYRFTAITGVNTLFNAMVNNPKFQNLDFSGLRITLGGGMAVQQAVAEKWAAVTKHPLIEAYGLTETCPAATINPLDLTAYNGSIGLPISSTEVMLRDDDGKEVPLGQPGEICIRGPQVMAGYWQHPEETAKVLDKNGWFATGDIGVMDERGFVRIVDRKKDMILVSGFNVYPNEIEGVAVMHPGVLECAAVGVPDKKSGEAVKLFVVKKDEKLTAEEVAEALPRAPDGLQGAARRGVPQGIAEDERRQDPAPRAARRGDEEGGVSAPAEDKDAHASRAKPRPERRGCEHGWRPTRERNNCTTVQRGRTEGRVGARSSAADTVSARVACRIQ